jgi:hypothetical protein
MIKLKKPYTQYEGKWLQDEIENLYFLAKYIDDLREPWETTKLARPKFLTVGSVRNDTYIIYHRQHIPLSSKLYNFIEPTREEKHNLFRGLFKK